MANKILIVGGTGLLGSELACHLSPNYEIIRAGSDDVDIRDYDNVRGYFKKSRPEIVINCAAMAQVDRCEREREMAHAVNCTGAVNLARACRESGAYLLHYSTDYVFDGNKKKPYLETDTADPINVYGVTKLAAEKGIGDVFDNYAILRVAWLYADHERSFVRRLIQQGVKQLVEKGHGEEFEPIKMVVDQVGTPTDAVDVAYQTEKIIEKKLTGLFHCTAQGETGRYNLAELIFNHMSMPVDLVPVKRDEFGYNAPRPAYSVLENGRLKASGLDIMPDYDKALMKHLNKTEEIWTK